MSLPNGHSEGRVEHDEKKSVKEGVDVWANQDAYEIAPEDGQRNAHVEQEQY